MTTRDEIRVWFEGAKSAGATHMLVVCDTFDYDDYPVYVMPGEDVSAREAEYNGKNMQRVMEVYAMHLPMEDQLGERRAFHFDAPPRIAEPPQSPELPSDPFAVPEDT